MVEQEFSLDAIFGSLSDPTRRDILKRISRQSMSVGSIAEYYSFSFAGVAKHLDVLERAGLINKTRRGKEQIVTIDPSALAAANDYLEDYKRLWGQRLDSLDTYLKSMHKKGERSGRE
jgi:DNA-binding transcriptional ArsR family regulator